MENNEMQKLIRALRHRAVDILACLGCEYSNGCSVHGCQINMKAADLLNELQQRNAELEKATRAKHQAYFRLGQMDMRESVATMLRKKASDTFGITSAALLAAADMVEAMEVMK